MIVLLAAGVCLCNSAFAEITYHVTNLNASGSGSFAACLASANSDGQASRIVFDVSGTIQPGAVQNLTEGNCTICGTYVPPPGITFDFNNVSTGFNVTSGNNRFCNIRVINTKTNNDGISPHGAGSNVIVERCSFDLCRDEGVGMSNSYGNTIAFSRFENCGSQPGDGTGFANGRGILITGGSAVIVGCSVYHCNRGITLNTDGFLELRHSLLEASWSNMSGSGFTNAGGSHCYSNVIDCVANNNPFSGFMFRNNCKFYRSGNSGEGNGSAWNGQVPPEQWLEYVEAGCTEYSSPITGTDTPDYLPLPSWLTGAQTPSSPGSVGMGTGICQCYGGSGNTAPVTNAGADQKIILPNPANLDGTVTDDGLPNPPGAVTTTWTMTSGPSTVTFGNPNAIDTTASFSVKGVYVLRLTASDSELWTYDELTVTVGNNPPSVDAGPDQQITLPDFADLDGTVTDDGLPDPPGVVTTLWTQQSGPGTVTFGNPNAIDTNAVFSESGTYVLRLTADDSELQPYDELTVTVVTNNPPSVNAGQDQQITLPAAANLDGTVTDDGKPNPPGAVTTTWTKQSGPGTVTFGNPNAIDTTANFSTTGTYVLRLTANDSELQAYDELTVTVRHSWSESANYYVDGQNGSDSNPGSSSQPWATLTKAVSTATSGQKVLVWGGQTYTGALTLSKSGTSASPITFKRDPASGTATINGNGGTTGAIYSTTASYNVIDGFTLTNNRYGFYNYGAANGLIVKNCRITGNTQYGVYIRSGDNHTLFNDAIYTNGSAYAGVYVYSSALNNNVTQCSIYNHKWGVYYNTSCTGGIVTNSIIANHATNGVRCASSSTCTVTYTDNWSNGTNYYGCSAGTGCISANPLWVSPSTGDFHLGSGSPAHNTASDGLDMGYRYSSSAL